MFVSVNLSAHDLVDNHIINVISQALIASDLAPQRLHLEVTESAVVDEADKAAMLLREMRQMGMSIAIDDFGTGYSSLSYLDKLPLNKVKIDRSFVRDIVQDEQKLKLLRGIIHMSRELGLEIVTEGVETNEQLEVIRKNNCADIIQGFIFGMPMPRSAIRELSRKLDRTQDGVSALPNKQAQ
ncbi:MAG: EAL domain-containing protein, partial [Lentilitoribacter sp.]